MLKKKTIMLIGGAGYVGAMLAKKLLKEAHTKATIQRFNIPVLDQ